MSRLKSMTIMQPTRCTKTGLWLARYRRPDGSIGQAGRFKLKAPAQRAIEDATRDAWGITTQALEEFTVSGFFEVWPDRFPRPKRTEETNRHRIRCYVLPHLPHEGDFPLAELRRPMVRDVQRQLLVRGLAKRTIDHAISALSTMLNDAIEDELIDSNVAHGMRVRLNDPRLKPKRKKRERRAVPPDEIAAFMEHLPAEHHAVCWTPVLTGARPGAVFAMRREDIERQRELIYIHQTADPDGGILDGSKRSHHIPEKERRGYWTLFPRPLIELCDALPARLSGWLHVSPRGRIWRQNNFYRNVWNPARKASGTDFTLYDLRHTFASRLHAAGIPLADIAAWMDHSLRAGGAPVNTTTTHYTHPTFESLPKALEVMYELHATVAARLRQAR